MGGSPENPEWNPKQTLNEGTFTRTLVEPPWSPYKEKTHPSLRVHVPN